MITDLLLVVGGALLAVIAISVYAIYIWLR